MSILYAITAHGFGHFMRSAALLNAIHELAPEEQLHVAVDLPEALVRSQLPFPFTYRKARYEPGVAQHNCLDNDLPGTVAAYQRFLDERPERLAEERRYLQRHLIDGVISDIAALPIRAAGELCVPAIGVANFTWDWILEPLLAGTSLAELPALLAEDYAHGRELLLLPFGQTTSVFPRTTPVGLLCRHARHDRRTTLQKLGLPEGGAPVVLVSLGGWSGGGLPAITVDPALQARFVVSEGLDIRFPGQPVCFGTSLPQDLLFPDLLRAADAVVTKPGYGMASECRSQGTPVLFVERQGFREAPRLIAALQEHQHPLRILSRAQFSTGDWAPAISELLRSPRPTPQPAENRRLAALALARLSA